MFAIPISGTACPSLFACVSSNSRRAVHLLGPKNKSYPPLTIIPPTGTMKRYKAGLIALTVLLSSLSALAASTARTISESKYSVAHSLGDNYIFDPRDGWQTVNVTNLAYKYKRGPKGSPQRPKSKSVLNGELGSVVNKIWEGLKGVGSTESVIITWYVHCQKTSVYWF